MIPESGWIFHHVGYVVASIEQTADSLTKSLDLTWDGKIFHDPNQRVRVSFFRAARGPNPTIELVEPADPDSPVDKFLKKGGGLHHLCYEVDSLEAELERARANRGLITRPPMPAVAFDGRRIAWVFTRNKLLVEFLEK